MNAFCFLGKKLGWGETAESIGGREGKERNLVGGRASLTNVEEPRRLTRLHKFTETGASKYGF